MKLSCLLFLLLLNICSCATGSAPEGSAVEVRETASFNDVVQTVKDKSQLYGNSKVLVVVDIDNTLLTSDSDLGGDIWYQWQRGSLDVKPREEQKVACLFEDSINLLYELAPMSVTEHSVPQVIKDWQKQGLTVFALTSRSPGSRAATERELSRAGIDLSVSALSHKDQASSLLLESIPRKMSYMQGVMMTSGMDKGLMLKYILNNMQQQFDAIVFVDDSQKNIDNLQSAFSSDVGLDMILFHYTRIEDQRLAAQGTILTQEQADQMARQWRELSQLIESIFPARQTGVCLNTN